MKKFLNDPLLHFLLIGAALFFSFEIFSKPVDDSGQEIIVTQGDIASLEANFKRTWQRPPNEEELGGLIDNRVRDEIAYREAKAMGLDKGDTNIQRRLRMKLELLLEDIAGLEAPTEADLRNYLEKNRQSFYREPQFSFKQVYFSIGNQETSAEDRARQTLAVLDEAGSEADPAQYGDATMLPGDFPLSYVSTIKRQFGKTFVTRLEEAATGKWFGPLASEYGLHLVFVRQRIPGRFPELAEVRNEVERDWTAWRRERVKEDAYRKLRERYRVLIEEPQSSTDAKSGSDS